MRMNNNKFVWNVGKCLHLSYHHTLYVCLKVIANACNKNQPFQLIYSAYRFYYVKRVLSKIKADELKATLHYNNKTSRKKSN